MSRSVRKQPVQSHSDRYCRKLDIRRARRRARDRLRRGGPESDVPPTGQHPDRDVGRSGRWRVDPRRWPKVLRK